MTWVKPIQKSLSVLGNYSLQIYCIHMVFVEYVVVRYPAGIYGWPLAAVDLLYVLMGAVVSFLCVGMSYAVLDRIPIYRWIMLGKWPQKTK
jgi:membrane-bound acyltransferase YfiQ involved in biofilm formation